MRRERLLTAVVVLIAAVAVSGCSSQDVTQQKVQTDVALVYGHLLAKRDRLLHKPVPRGLRVAAACYRGGPETPDVGPGKDWRCDVTAASAGHAKRKASYLLNVRTNACW